MSQPLGPTPRVDAAERFLRSGTANLGFVMSPLARQLEIELNQALAALQAAGLPLPGSDESVASSPATARGEAGQSAAVVNSPVSSPSAAPVAVQAKPPIADQDSPPPARLAPSKAPTNAGETVAYQDGQILFNKGDSAQHLAIIVEGAVEVFDPVGNQILATLGVGSSFGEQAVLEGGVRGASVRAVGQVQCIEINTVPLRAVLRNDPGVLRPTVEALLLQLGMVNQITRLLSTPGGAMEYRIAGEEDVNALDLQRKLADVYANPDTHGLSAEQLMFLKLESSDKLLTSLYPAGHSFAATSIDDLGDAYVLVAGTAQARFGNKTVQLGRGSILGLAEAISGQLVPWQLTAVGDVTVKTLSVGKVLRDLERANSGIRGIVRYTIARILDLQMALID